MDNRDDEMEAHPLAMEARAWGEGEIARLEGEHKAALADRDRRLAKLDREIERTAIRVAAQAALIGKVESKFLRAAMALFVETTPMRVDVAEGAPQVTALTTFGEITVEAAASAFLASELGAPLAPKAVTHPGEWASAIRKLH